MKEIFEELWNAPKEEVHNDIFKFILTFFITLLTILILVVWNHRRIIRKNKQELCKHELVRTSRAIICVKCGIIKEKP